MPCRIAYYSLSSALQQNILWIKQFAHAPKKSLISCFPYFLRDESSLKFKHLKKEIECSSFLSLFVLVLDHISNISISLHVIPNYRIESGYIYTTTD